MRLQVSPERVELAEQGSFEVLITVTNTADVIGGYHLRLLGADPSWVDLEAENLSLFPDTSQTVRAVVRIPPGLGAGDRRIAVQVRELTPPQAIAVAEIELVVPPREALRLSLAPMTVVGGTSARFGLLAENTGNTRVSAVPVGLDPEEKIRFTVVPAVLDLAPGDHAMADLRATARRRWFGNPVVRPFGVAVLPVGAAGGGGPAEPAEPPEPLATGSLVQKPRLSRGLLSLLSLLLALSVFAVVITIALSQLVGVSAADRDLAIQVAAAQQNTAGSGSGSEITGTVVLLTNGAPARGVTVEVFASGSLITPITSTATGDDGSFVLVGLPTGAYKLRFRGAGFAEVWYPAALSGEAAKEIPLQAGKDVTNLTVQLGGLPASVSGRVIGDDVAGAILTVQVPVDMLPRGQRPAASTARPTVTAAPAASSAAAAAPTDTAGAVLMSVPIGSDGTFELTDLGSPLDYELVVSKTGYTTDTQRIDLGGGESRTGVQLQLRTGDGLISGTVTGPDGPIGNAVVTATTGTTTVSTVSQTKSGDGEGEFTLPGLVTPSTYTVTVTAEGFGAQTSTLSLAAGQQLGGVQVNLSRSTGEISGVVSTVADQKPAAGVSVTVGVADKTVQTVTQSGDTVGAWTVAGLPLPGTYTVTFARADLQSQTLIVSLDAAGQPSTGTSGLAVAMKSAFAAIHGRVTQGAPAGEATVTLSSGTDTYAVISASVPQSAKGNYRIDNIKPGTYTLSVSRTGTSPTVLTVTLVAGADLPVDMALVQPASIGGTVVARDNTSVSNLEVALYESSRYPEESYRTTRTDSKGKFVFTDVNAPQSYVIEVRSSAAGALGSTIVTLQPSEQQNGLTLSVGAVGATTSAPATAGGG